MNMTQTAKLTASDGAADDWFGYSVSISGNTVVVGAPVATVGDNNSQGAAYVFTEPASGWADMTQTAKLTASDGAADDGFGFSVSISGNTVVVGAAGDAVDGNARRGRPTCSRSPPPVWTQTAKLTASDGAADDGFGGGRGFDQRQHGGGRSGNAAVSGNGGEGAAYVFTEPASGWANMTQTAKLTASDGAAIATNSAKSVSISGNTVVVGAFYANGADRERPTCSLSQRPAGRT